MIVVVGHIIFKLYIKIKKFQRVKKMFFTVVAETFIVFIYKFVNSEIQMNIKRSWIIISPTAGFA